MFNVIKQQVVVGDALVVGNLARTLPIEDAEIAVNALSNQRLELRDGLHASQSQQRPDTLLPDLSDGIVIVATPDDGRVSGRKDALETDGWNAQFSSRICHSLMKLHGKRMACVYQQTDAVFLAEYSQLFLVHGSLKTYAMMQHDFLLIASR